MTANKKEVVVFSILAFLILLSLMLAGFASAAKAVEVDERGNLIIREEPIYLPPADEKTQADGMNWKIWIIVGIIVCIALLIIAILIKIIKNKNKLKRGNSR